MNKDNKSVETIHSHTGVICTANIESIFGEDLTSIPLQGARDYNNVINIYMIAFSSYNFQLQLLIYL